MQGALPELLMQAICMEHFTSCLQSRSLADATVRCCTGHTRGMGGPCRSCKPQPAAPAAGGTQLARLLLRQLSWVLQAWPPLARVAALLPEQRQAAMLLHLGRGCGLVTPPSSRAVPVQRAGPEAGLPSLPLGVQCMPTQLQATSRKCAAPRYKGAEPRLLSIRSAMPSHRSRCACVSQQHSTPHTSLRAQPEHH